MRLRILENIINFQNHVCRRIHLTKVAYINPNNVTEIKIPVPWGHIAGKWWGDRDMQPILAVHGWQDNSGSWDPLLERLPDSRSVLAIDSPGHGLSSHLPPGTLYHNANHLMALRRVQQHFRWTTELTIMGHSEGGILAFIFSVLYPEVVKTLIAIDVIKPLAPKAFNMEELGSAMDKLIRNSKRDSSENPQYSLSDAKDRWFKGIIGLLTENAVETLMKRGVQIDKASGKCFYTRDPKLKIDSLHGFDEEHSLEMGRNLKCDYLVIMATESGVVDYSLKDAPTFVKTVAESAKSFKMVEVEGNHHVHLTHPDRVLPVISEFLDRVDSSLGN